MSLLTEPSICNTYYSFHMSWLTEPSICNTYYPFHMFWLTEPSICNTYYSFRMSLLTETSIWIHIVHSPVANLQYFCPSYSKTFFYWVSFLCAHVYIYVCTRKLAQFTMLVIQITNTTKKFMLLADKRRQGRSV
jgi:hypothetical protein